MRSNAPGAFLVCLSNYKCYCWNKMVFNIECFVFNLPSLNCLTEGGAVSSFPNLTKKTE